MAAKGVNKVILIGNVGQDPDARYMPNGGAVTSLSLATSEAWKDKNTGEQQERTEWHRVVFYQRLAEVVAQYVQKGHKLYVEGSLRTRSWEQDGVKRYSTEIVASDMQMLSGAQSRENESAERPRQERDSQASPRMPSQEEQARYQTGFDDDIPF